jgi:gliding motility-associated-like protein
MKKLLLLIILCIQFVYNSSSQQVESKKWISTNIFKTDYFIENNGQYNSKDPSQAVLYSLQENGQQFYFTQKGFYVEVNGKSKVEKENSELANEINEKNSKTDVEYIEFEWQNCNTNFTILPVDQSKHYFSYGDEKYKSYGYKSLTYVNIYNNIDVVFKVHPTNGIEYSLIIHPGGDISKVSFKYNNSTVSYSNSKKELQILKNKAEITEKELHAFYENGKKIDIDYLIDGNNISFSTSKTLDKSKTIIIDPWVTSLSNVQTSSVAYDVDFDNNNNLIAFGGYGPGKLSKYNQNGNLQWTFMGYVVSNGWYSGNNLGNFVADKLSGKVYISNGLTAGGASVIRLKENGMYDNFITTIHASLEEIWELKYNCSTGDLIALGGGKTSDSHIGVVNTTTGAITPLNATGILSGLGHQDVVSAAVGSNGELYTLFNSKKDSTINNHIVKINTAYNGSIWKMPTGFKTFNEATNKATFTSAISNSFNAVSAENNRLYYYDGKHLTCYNTATGMQDSASKIVPSLGVKTQGGIATNSCNEIYVGGNAQVYKYEFSNNQFSSYTALPIVASNVGTVTDLVYNKYNKMLYVSGVNFVAIIDPQSNCAGIQTIEADSIMLCPDSALVIIKNPIPNMSYTFIWEDLQTNTILKNTKRLPGVISDTVAGLINGKNYKITISYTVGCEVYSKTIKLKYKCFCIGNGGGSGVGGIGALYSVKTICQNEQYILSNGKQIADAGTYIDTLQNLQGLDSFVIIYVNPTYYSNIKASICKYQTYTLPNGNIVDTTGQYTCTYTSILGCDSIIIVDLLVLPVHIQNILSIDTTICIGESIPINKTLTLENVTYLWNDNSIKPVNKISNSGVYYVSTFIPPCTLITDTFKINTKDCECIASIPNAFTPNNDSKNDYFKPLIHCEVEPSNYIFQVYNRWGQQVFVSKTLNNGWDGTFQNKNQDIGTYMYFVSYINTKSGKKETHKGDVILIR